MSRSLLGDVNIPEILQMDAFKTDRIFAFDCAREDKQVVPARGILTNNLILISDF